MCYDFSALLPVPSGQLDRASRAPVSRARRSDPAALPALENSGYMARWPQTYLDWQSVEVRGARAELRLVATACVSCLDRLLQDEYFDEKAC